MAGLRDCLITVFFFLYIHPHFERLAEFWGNHKESYKAVVAIKLFYKVRKVVMTTRFKLCRKGLLLRTVIYEASCIRVTILLR